MFALQYFVLQEIVKTWNVCQYILHGNEIFVIIPPPHSYRKKEGANLKFIEQWLLRSGSGCRMKRPKIMLLNVSTVIVFIHERMKYMYLPPTSRGPLLIVLCFIFPSISRRVNQDPVIYV